MTDKSTEQLPEKVRETLNAILRHGRPAPTMEGLPPSLRAHVEAHEAAIREALDEARRLCCIEKGCPCECHLTETEML